jgi:hypothetical protein
VTHQLLGEALQAVLLFLGLLSLLRLILLEVGDFWRFFKQWRAEL